MKAQPIDVVIADSQYLIRLGLRHLFEDHARIRVVDEVTESDELYASVKVRHPQVVILDHDRPNCFSVKDIHRIRAEFPETQFLIISADGDKRSIFSVLQAGALSFLTKECDEEEIVGAVLATAKGEKFLCNKVIDVILEKQIPAEEETCAPSNLTVRELDVVRLTARGYPARRIAEELFLSTHTVYTHRKNIMRKLGVNSASEIVIYAMKNGLGTAT